MQEFNNWHPIPRYGLAASLAYLGEKLPTSLSSAPLGAIALEVLSLALNDFILAPQPGAIPGTIFYKPMPAEQLNPGKKSGQVSANGYFIAPHALTSNNAADLLKEAYNIMDALKKGEAQNYELKRSFAPLVAKLNAGKASMSNPKVELIQAAYTAIAILIKTKPAAFVKDFNDNFGNAGIIPDLPFSLPDSGHFPLYDFVKLFREIQSHGIGEDSHTVKTTQGKFPRPSVFNGNYPNAPRAFNLGSVSLLAAIGKWASENQILYEDTSRVLHWLQNRPIYIVSYIGTQQEQFGHHLVDLAMTGELHLITQKAMRVSIIGLEDGKKMGTPKWKLFMRSFDHFLRFFNQSHFQNFLAHRATYPVEFLTLLKTYFMQTGKYPEEIINAALAYGRSLNRAAYITAKQEAADDAQKGRAGRSLTEYKHRVLLQLESIIQSAKNGGEMAARLNAQVGRLTMQDIHSDSVPFITAMINESISVEEAKNLTTAFMRLSYYQPTSPSEEGEAFTFDEEDLPAETD